jgi:PAS domain S-box-containing protein
MAENLSKQTTDATPKSHSTSEPLHPKPPPEHLTQADSPAPQDSANGGQDLDVLFRFSCGGLMLHELVSQTQHDRLLRVNDILCQLLGYSPEQMYGLTLRDILAPEEPSEPADSGGAECEGILTCERTLLTKDGRHVMAEVSMRRVEIGGRQLVLSSIHDITNRKEAERALHENEQRLRLALEGGAMGRWDWDLRTDSMVWCERVFELLGLDASHEAKIETFLNHIHPDDRDRVKSLMAKAMADQKDFEVEFRVVRSRQSCGEVTWLASHAKVVYDERGRAVRVIGVMYDITRRKQMEAELRRLTERLEEEVEAQTEELRETIDRLQDEISRRVTAEDQLHDRSRMLEAFFQHTITPLMFLDCGFNVIRVNKACAQAAGEGPEGFVGRDYFVLRPRGEDRAILEEVVRTKRPYVAHARPFTDPQNPDLPATYWDWQITPLLDEAGQVHSLVLNLRDVTDQQKAYCELEQRASQLQKLALELSQAEDRERRRLAEILHDDLQQILAAAKFHVGLLEHENQRPEELQEIVGQIKQMLRDAIDKSRSLSHELRPPGLSQGDLADAFEWLARQMQTKHGLTVSVETRGRIDVRSEALKTFLCRIGQEALFNVVKHAGVAQARLRVRGGHGWVRLTISDCGRGFDPKTLAQTNGFGLLSVRERVGLLGGCVRIRSVRGRGTTVAISLPDDTPERRVIQGATERKKRHEYAAGRRVHVLLVDDQKVMREGLAALLNEQDDIEVVGQACDGREAVDLVRTYEPDVVIMDEAMPGMTGAQATRLIKQYRPQTCVIALSMFDQPDVADRMLSAGAAAFLVKTAPAEELLAAIRASR